MYIHIYLRTMTTNAHTHTHKPSYICVCLCERKCKKTTDIKGPDKQTTDIIYIYIYILNIGFARTQFVPPIQDPDDTASTFLFLKYHESI
jgi:hypothetical protein